MHHGGAGKRAEELHGRRGEDAREKAPGSLLMPLNVVWGEKFCSAGGLCAARSQTRMGSTLHIPILTA